MNCRIWTPARANCCKKLTKRRLFARAAIAALEQSTRDGRHAARSSVSRSAGGVPRSPSPCEAALQFMRTSLARPPHAYTMEVDREADDFNVLRDGRIFAFAIVHIGQSIGQICLDVYQAGERLCVVGNHSTFRS